MPGLTERHTKEVRTLSVETKSATATGRETLTRAQCRGAAGVLALMVMGIAVVVMCGWIFDVEILKRIHPSLVTMKANTSVCFMLLGIALRLQLGGSTSPAQTWAARIMALSAGAIGLLSFLEHILSVDFGIDHLLFREGLPEAGRSVPGRMAPATGFNFLLLGTAISLLDRRGPRAYKTIAALTLLAASVTLLAFIAYFYGAKAVHEVPLLATIALHTVVTFLTLCLGVLMARPAEGVVAVMTSDTSGGVLARRLLPTAVLLPVIFGWLALAGSQAGWFNLAMGLAGVAVVLMIIFTALVWNAAATVNRLDAQRTRHAHRVRETEERFRVLADSSPVLMWVNDLEGCQFVNRAYVDFFGRGENDLLGYGWAEFVHPEDRAKYIESYKAAAAKRGLFNAEARLLRHDGEYRWVISTGVPRVTRSGDLEGYVGSSVDITDIVKARQALARHRDELEATVNERTAKLRELVEELETFSYSVSHDMRAPLRAMSSYSTILLGEHGAKLGEEGAALLTRIKHASLRLDRLITDVLSYSRVVRAELNLQRVEMDQLVRQIVEHYPEWQAPKVEIRIEGTLAPVMGNEALLTQCITNLIGNAVKFVAANTVPRVRIWSGGKGDKVRFYFEDNGIGIDPADQRRIFRLFERVHGPEFDGTGLGLSIVRKAVERMNGDFGLNSEPGGGSTFWIELNKAQ